MPLPTKSEIYWESRGYKVKGKKKCLNCGKEFKVYLKRDLKRKKFCGRSCSYKYYHKKYPKLKENLELGHTPESVKKAVKKRVENFKKGLYPKWEEKIRTILHSPEVIEKARQSNSGENHWHWIKDRSKVKRRRWDNSERVGKIAFWRISIFKRDNYTCQICGKYGEKLNAHHIMAWAKYPKLRYEIKNGITMCSRCHRKFHHKYGLYPTKSQLKEFMATNISLYQKSVKMRTSRNLYPDVCLRKL